MAAVSGFDPLFVALERSLPGKVHNTLPPDIDMRDRKYLLQGLLNQMFKRSKSKINKSANSPFVEPRHENMAMDALHKAQLYPDSLILLAAGENQLGLTFDNAGDLVRKKIIVCLHQPPSWLRLNWRDFSNLNGLGAIVCLSSEQARFVSNVCTTPIIVSRHGVCHDFFKPADTVASVSSPRLIFVGQWLRDFDTLVESMGLIWQEQPETSLDCVIIREARNHPALLRLARDSRVKWHANITPEALRDLYQQADLLFLPLIDAAANNAIVESLASGLPIISSQVGGAVEYIPENAGELCAAGDAHAHAHAVLQWLQSRERIRESALVARKFAENDLDWGNIASNLISEIQHLF
jgi:glycosyltransferase involved in cell wall biosynthesis